MFQTRFVAWQRRNSPTAGAADAEHGAGVSARQRGVQIGGTLPGLLRLRYHAAPPPRVVFLLGALLLVGDLAVATQSILGTPHWQGSTDLGIYVRAAQAIARGANPYEYTTASQSSYGAVKIFNLYVYPPAFAEALLPFLAVGEEFTRWAWFVTVFASAVASIIVLLRGFGPTLRWQFVLLIVAFVCSTPNIRSSIYYANADLVLTLLLVLALYALVHGHQRATGILLGSTLVVKPFLGVLVFFLIWKRLGRAATWALVTSTGLFILSLIPFRGRELTIISSWLNAVNYYSSVAFATFPRNVSMKGLLERLFMQNPFTVAWLDSPALTQILGIAVVIPVVLLFTRAVPRTMNVGAAGERSMQLLTESSLALALAFTVSPLTETAHLVFLVPGLVGVSFLAAQRLSRGTCDGRRWAIAALLWALLLGWYAFGLRTPGLPSQKEWVQLEGLAILLTGFPGYLLIAASAMLAWTLMPRQQQAGMTEPGR